MKNYIMSCIIFTMFFRALTFNPKIQMGNLTPTSRSRLGRNQSVTRRTTSLATSIQSLARCLSSRPLCHLTTPSPSPSWTGTDSPRMTSSERPRLTWKTGFSASTDPLVDCQNPSQSKLCMKCSFELRYKQNLVPTSLLYCSCLR